MITKHLYYIIYLTFNCFKRKEQRKIKKAGDYKDLPGTLDFEVSKT